MTIWAYPKTPGFYEDSVVCCVKENPEPILFKVSAHGVRPELELDRKLIQFDRVLLHRFVVFLYIVTINGGKLSGVCQRPYRYDPLAGKVDLSSRILKLVVTRR